ncbi:hypothetical protein EZV62_019370 [Acer yangbiense]|uniref:Uncharacterized protein n=1 Tax=Acer yangbiense TaxID=1000413 RepID=A0A5C7HAX9_9ROSI|nr:hypothetical protein EZV62_019370 [Acer yangbiense]
MKTMKKMKKAPPAKKGKFHHSGKLNQSRIFDHFWFVLTWPPSFCELDNDTSPLVQDLNAYWPNFGIDNINKCFWKHEWDKHGRTISEWNEQEPVTPEDYFMRAVKLIKNISINISSALNGRDLVANDSSYPVSNFTSAITSVTGNETVMLNCTAGIYNNLPVLGEVRLCVDRNATGFIKCSGENERNRTQNSCGEGAVRIRFPGL